jgi:glycosyltransferase involved in cell wall biosynthesis
MRLLVVDHNALDPANRLLYEHIVALGGIELRLVVPTKWFNNYVTLRFDSSLWKQNYEFVASDVLFSGRTHRLIYLSLNRHLKEFQPDIIYMNAEPENFQSYQAALNVGSSKFVFSSWRNIDHSLAGFPYKFSFLHGAIEKKVLEKATHGIVFNHEAKRIFSRLGFDHTTVIHPAVDTKMFAFRPVESKTNFVVGYVGRLIRAKGVDLLLEAIARLPRNCEALIVGDGPEKESLQQLAGSLSVGDRVRFIDGVANSAMPEVYSSMDALVLPSRTTEHWKEQFGRVLIEAMACGIPVIGSSSGEIPHVIGEAGFVFKEGSVEGLQLGIERLRLNDIVARELRDAGFKRVNRLFTIESIALQHHQLFTSL